MISQTQYGFPSNQYAIDTILNFISNEWIREMNVW